MTQDEVKTYLEDLGAVERMKSNLDNLQIEWETDVDKIDLTVLSSNPKIPNIPGTQLKIEWIEIPYSMDVDYSKNMFVYGELERFLGLYKLIERGVKIIPPLVIRDLDYVNGEPTVKEQLNLGSISDGVHRLILSKHLKLSRIPVLVAEFPSKHFFNKSMWNITYNENSIELTEKNGEIKFNLPLANSWGTLTESGDYLFQIHSTNYH